MVTWNLIWGTKIGSFMELINHAEVPCLIPSPYLGANHGTFMQMTQECKRLISLYIKGRGVPVLKTCLVPLAHSFLNITGTYTTMLQWDCGQHMAGRFLVLCPGFVPLSRSRDLHFSATCITVSPWPNTDALKRQRLLNGLYVIELKWCVLDWPRRVRTLTKYQRWEFFCICYYSTTSHESVSL